MYGSSLAWRFNLPIIDSRQLGSVIHEECVKIKEISTPPTPPAGYGCLFFDEADGHYKVKRSNGTVVDLEAAGGSSVPTGTGFRHVTGGEEDAASKLVQNADVHASAGIVESKLALSFPTHSNAQDHSNANDPSSGEKSALAGTSGTPGSGNRFVTDADARNTNARTPTTHNHAQADVTNLASDLAGKVATSRAIATTAPLSGGGDLSGDRTLSVADFVGSGASHARGTVPTPGASAGTTRFLREDATWSVPPAGGGGSGNFASTTVVLEGALLYKATITGQSWVTPSSRLVASVYADPVSGTTVEMLAVAGLVVTLANIVNGVGFDVYAYNPNGLTGTVTIHIVGG